MRPARSTWNRCSSAPVASGMAVRKRRVPASAAGCRSMPGLACWRRWSRPIPQSQEQHALTARGGGLSTTLASVVFRSRAHVTTGATLYRPLSNRRVRRYSSTRSRPGSLDRATDETAEMEAVLGDDVGYHCGESLTPILQHLQPPRAHLQRLRWSR